MTTSPPPPGAPGQTPQSGPAPAAPLHPLERKWAVWTSGGQKLPDRGRKPSQENKANPIELTRIGSFDTIEDFWGWYHAMPPPSKLGFDANLFLFQDDVAPAWEHVANAQGGRWLHSAASLSDNSWRDLVLTLIGETFEHAREITGLVLSRRFKYFRISVWTRDRKNETAAMAIGKTTTELLGVKDLNYQDHGATYESGYRYTIKS